jgi:hypothetical protein
MFHVEHFVCFGRQHPYIARFAHAFSHWESFQLQNLMSWLAEMSSFLGSQSTYDFLGTCRESFLSNANGEDAACGHGNGERGRPFESWGEVVGLRQLSFAD